MKSKILSGFIFTLVFLAFFTACSSTNEDDSVVISVWNRHPELNEPWADFIDEFESEYPDIKVELENIPVSTQAASYQAAVSEGNLPDIFDLATYSIDELVHLDLLKNLDELFPEEEKDNYYPGTWFEGGTTLNGNVYIFPVFSPNHGTNMMYYNKNVLEEFGVAEDEIPETWDEFISVGKDIYEKSDKSTYGLAFYNAEWAVTNFVNPQSTVLNPETPTTMNLVEGKPEYKNQGTIESINFLKELYEERIMHPSSLEVDTFQAEAEFIAGNAAFYINGNWSGSDITSLGFDDWGVTDIPTMDGKQWYSDAARGVDGLAVSKETEHWDEVKILLEYAKEHIYSKVVISSGASQPSKMNVSGDAPFPQFNQILELMTAASLPIPKPAERSLEVIEFERRYNELLSLDSIGDLTIGYLSGEVDDVGEELEKMDEEANKIFDELLEESDKVSRKLYQFPNWEPYTPYLEEDYEELE